MALTDYFLISKFSLYLVSTVSGAEMAHFCYNRLIGQCKISYDLYSCRKIRKVILVATTLKIEKKNVDFSRILYIKTYEAFCYFKKFAGNGE